MNKIEKPYNYKNCQSLFGYAQRVHVRSGGICQLCNCGSGLEVDFDLWRQLTWEHIIGESQGGYLKEIRIAVARRFQRLPANEIEEIARRIEEANIVTCCSFCNSTTSRGKAPTTMDDIIDSASGAPEDVVTVVETQLEEILTAKKQHVAWKIASVKKAFEEQIAPTLNGKRQQARTQGGHLP